MAQLRIIKAERNLSLGGSERITKSRNPIIISTKMVESLLCLVVVLNRSNPFTNWF